MSQERLLAAAGGDVASDTLLRGGRVRAMSFLGLEVIPSLKITDLGLSDVDAFRPVGRWA